MSDYTQIFDDTVSPTLLIGQTTLSAIKGSSGNGLGSSVGTISGNWYPSGSIFGNVPPSITAESMLTGTLYFVPFFIDKAATFTQIAIVNGGSPSGTVVLGLYADSGSCSPTGSPLANSNSGSITMVNGAVAAFTFGSPIALPAGVTWGAYSCSATTKLFGNSTTTVLGRGMGISATPTSSFLQQCGWNQTFVYSATLPSVGSLTASVSALAGSPGDASMYLLAQ